METLAPHPKPVRLLYFWIGLLATFLYRAIIVLNLYSATLVKVAWYVGTVGFLLYFAHRYQISEKRARLIRQYDLQGKVGRLPGLSPEERGVLDYIFGTLQSSKEKWNYIFIFVMSGLALAVGIVLDFFR